MDSSPRDIYRKEKIVIPTKIKIKVNFCWHNTSDLPTKRVLWRIRRKEDIGMGLTTCPKCEETISEKATVCPRCNSAVKQKQKKTKAQLYP